VWNVRLGKMVVDTQYSKKIRRRKRRRLRRKGRL
jgi:hypothetical protein